MPHLRQRVRAAAAVQLAAAGTVRKSRVRPLQLAELPCIIVYTLRQRSTRMDAAGTLSHAIDLVIDGHVKATDDLDDRLDDLSAAIEAAIAADPTLGGAAEDAVLAETLIDLAGEGETATGLVRLRFLVTAYGDPEG